MEASALRRQHAHVLPGSRRLLAALGDDRLVEQIRRGNTTAFEVVFDRHYRGILSFCRHMLGSREEAEDAVQQTFASAYSDLQSNDRDIRLKAWLYTIARNRCLTMLRARREQPAEIDEMPTAGLTEEVQQRADLRELLDDLRELPEEQREALVLFEIGDLSQTEVANVIGVEPVKVKALVYQARTSLIENREARAIPCSDIREQLATASGGALRRGPLRRHLKSCDGCREYRDHVRAQRHALALVLPVVPTVGFRESVLSALGIGGGAGGAGIATGGVAAGASAVGSSGFAGGSGLLAAIGGAGAAKLAVAAVVTAGAIGGSGLALNEATDEDGPASARASHASGALGARSTRAGSGRLASGSATTVGRGRGTAEAADDRKDGKDKDDGKKDDAKSGDGHAGSHGKSDDARARGQGRSRGHGNRGGKGRPGRSSSGSGSGGGAASHGVGSRGGSPSGGGSGNAGTRIRPPRAPQSQSGGSTGGNGGGSTGGSGSNAGGSGSRGGNTPPPAPVAPQGATERTPLPQEAKDPKERVDALVPLPQ